MQPQSPYQPPSSIEPSPSQYQNSNSGLTLKQILFSFSGRIPRRTYWLWAIVAGLATILPIALLAPLLDKEGAGQIVAIVVLIPLVITFIWVSLAIRVKRWHDHGKSGAWVLIGMIPYIGGLISFIFLGCMRGNYGFNQYGDDPT